MSFEYSFGWMIGGLVIAAAGGLIVFFHRPIAENLANGVSSYDHVKLFGVVTIIVGLLVTADLHTFLLSLLVHLLFGK